MDKDTEKSANFFDKSAKQSARIIKDASRDRPRLFLAIDLPAELKEEIARSTRELNLSSSKRTDQQDKLKGAKPQDQPKLIDLQNKLKWTKQQNLHITMLFLGSQDRSVLKLLQDELPERLSSVEPFSAELSGLGAFPAPTRPRVLWLGVGKGSEQMMDISGKLGNLAEARGIASRDARFHPHVTLARIKAPIDLSLLVSSNDPKLKGLKPLEFKVTYISIFESVLSADGPWYDELGRIYL